MPVQPRLNSAAGGGSQFQLELLAATGLAGGAAGPLAETGNKTPAITWQQRSEGNRTPLNHRLTAHAAIHLSVTAAAGCPANHLQQYGENHKHGKPGR